MLIRACAAQSVAASFVETVNAGSLTMDPDEFVARMVAAGVPDMQLQEESSSEAHKSLHERLSSRGDQPGLSRPMMVHAALNC